MTTVFRQLNGATKEANRIVGATFTTSISSAYVGTLGGTREYWVEIDTPAIPAGSVIDLAFINVMFNGSGGSGDNTVTCKIVNEATPTFPTSDATAAAKTMSAGVSQLMAASVSPVERWFRFNMTSDLQTQVNLGGYGTSSKLIAQFSAAVASGWASLYTYGGYPTYGVSPLGMCATIVYRAPGSAASTVLSLPVTATANDAQYVPGSSWNTGAGSPAVGAGADWQVWANHGNGLPAGKTIVAAILGYITASGNSNNNTVVVTPKVITNATGAWPTTFAQAAALPKSSGAALAGINGFSVDQMPVFADIGTDIAALLAAGGYTSSSLIMTALTSPDAGTLAFKQWTTGTIQGAQLDIVYADAVAGGGGAVGGFGSLISGMGKSGL